MPIVIILAVAGLIYLLQDRIYRRFWARNLHAEVDYTDRFIHEGEKTELVETLSNGKILPLPWVYVKFRIDRNGKAYDYRSDLFSIRFFQQIRRRIPFKPESRGVYTIQGIDLISNNLFITSKFVTVLEDKAMMAVYPRLIDAEEYRIPFQKMMGEIVTRRFMIEDPFMFRGIREYQPYDSMKSINYKASAREGKWLVNVFDYTVSQKVTILMNMDRANRYYDMRLYESSIRMAASLAASFEQEGIPVELVTNGIDVLTGDPIRVESGCGSGHLEVLMEALSRLEVDLAVQDFSPEIQRGVENTDPDTMYMLISAFFGRPCVEAYERLWEVHPSTQWILPVTSADLTDSEFKGADLAAAEPNVTLWNVEGSL
ncbi:MAG: DUF58 domain-containing protein [Firmicutes bacterium]|nr:DUF58 domain-containing protein [Bacillota bacterium]